MTVVRSRRTVWWLCSIGAIVLMFATALPWLWARLVEAAALNELIRRHGDDFAIIEMHVAGEIGERMDLYRLLWNRTVNKREVWTRIPGAGNCHHAILVSDNRKVYVYYWSLRLDRLILRNECLIDHVRDVESSDYRYVPAQLERRRGVQWKRGVAGHPIGWDWLCDRSGERQ